MEIAEQVYKGGTTSKTTTKEESDCASHDRYCKGEGASLTTNTKKDRAGKRKNNHAGH